MSIYPCPDCMFSTIPCAKHSLPDPWPPWAVSPPTGNPGWQCPKCGRCWAPFVMGCGECNKVTVASTATTSTGATVTVDVPGGKP